MGVYNYLYMDNFQNYNNNQNFNSPNIPPLEERKDNHTALTVLLIVVLAFVGYFVFKSLNSNTADDSRAKALPDGNLITRAEENGVVSDFPTEIPIEEGAEISESYSINYVNDDKNLPVVSYMSNLTFQENLDKFGAYMKDNGWTILHEAEANKNVTFYYGKRGEEDLNVTFDNSGEKVFVTVAYSSSK